MSKKESSVSKKAAFIGIGTVSDVTAYQSFILLIFTFYYAVVGIEIGLITIGFIIWSVWNAFNDPIIGYISDRTHSKLGRRIPWIMIGAIPLAITMILLFTPLLPIGIANQAGNFVYFLIIIVIFEFFYTMYSLNLTSLFPEVFISEQERTAGNNIRQVFTIVGLIFAFILPGFIIDDYSDPQNFSQYQIFGIIACIIVAIGAVLFLKFGPRERVEFQKEFENAPNLINTMKSCVKSKAFMWYIPAEIANWFVYGMLPTIVPLFAKFVLEIEDALMISLLLGFTFLSAAIFMTIVWRPIVRKIGNRKSWMLSMTIWMLSLIPLLFIKGLFLGMIMFFLIGIGLSGSLYIIDLIVADIVDDDELRTGSRNEGGYYGVNAFFLRFSNVLVILAIGSVFQTVGWKVFEPTMVSNEVIFGLKALMVIFPIIALIVAILAIYKYPLDDEKLVKVKEGVKKLHEEKHSKI